VGHWRGDSRYNRVATPGGGLEERTENIRPALERRHVQAGGMTKGGVKVFQKTGRQTPHPDRRGAATQKIRPGSRWKQMVGTG